MTELSELAGFLDDVRVREEADQEGHVRLILEVPEDARGVPPAELLEAFRSALVHEGRLGKLARELDAELGTDEFLRILAEVVPRVAGPAALHPSRAFTEAEACELEAAGADLSPIDPDAVDPAARTAGLYTELLATALSTQEAAALLDVDESRIRQRLGERTLFGLKSGRAWRLPRFQFTEHGLVPGFEHVVKRLPEDLSPVAVYRWLTAPHPDLVVDGEAVAPLDWLRTGHDPGWAAELAAEL